MVSTHEAEYCAYVSKKVFGMFAYNRGTGKYTPLANIQFAVDWSDLSNPGLRANQ